MTRQALGVDAYSLRLQGWDAFRLVDYADRAGLDYLHLSERANLASLDPGYLAELAAEAARRGLTIEIGLGSIDPLARSFRPDAGPAEQQLADMLVAAARLGSPVVRCFLGDRRDREGAAGIAPHIVEVERVIAGVASRARDLGVRIALENHGGVDLLARELRALIDRIGNDVVGACLDTGNPAYAGEDPLLAAEVLAPVTVSTHVRDTAVWEAPDGAMAQWVPLGEGNVDLAAIVGVLERTAPRCPIDLEIIAGTAPVPVPYLRGEFWRAFPDVSAADAMRFAALARDGSRRGLGPRNQVLAPRGVAAAPDVVEALRAAQLTDVERSIDYARRVLGLGRRRIA